MTQKLKNTSLTLITILLLAAYVNSQTQISPWIAARPEAGIIFLSLIATPVLFGMVAAAYSLEWMGSMIGLYIQRKKEKPNKFKTIACMVAPPMIMYLLLMTTFIIPAILANIDHWDNNITQYIIVTTAAFIAILAISIAIVETINYFIAKILGKQIRNQYLLYTISMAILGLITLMIFLWALIVAFVYPVIGSILFLVVFLAITALYFLEWMGSMIGLYIQRKKEAINNLKVVVWTVVPPAAIYPLGIILYLYWFFSGHWNLLGVDEILSILLWYFIIPTILLTLTLTTLTIIIYSITSFIEKMLEKKIKNRYLLHTLSMLLLYLITVAPFLLLVVV